MSSQSKMHLELTVEQRRVLRHGLLEWLGPASCSEELARAMGFEDVEDLETEVSDRLIFALDNGEPLTALDWQRTLTATEFVWASSLFGASGDWSVVTSFSDDETLKILSEIRSKFWGSDDLHMPLFGTKPVS